MHDRTHKLGLLFSISYGRLSTAPFIGKGGLLIHCISGWDRTPLFISLLRLSLWADGKAHCSLSTKEILYFTLAYDWFAFGYVSVHYLRFHVEKNSSLLTAILSRRDGRKERRLCSSALIS
jgi:hypothetical protein